MKDSLFSVGTEVRYGNVSFNAELGLGFNEKDGTYMNLPNQDSPQFQLKLGTRFEF